MKGSCLWVGFWSLSLVAYAQPGPDYAHGYFGMRTGYIELEQVDDEGSFNVGLVGGIYLAPMLSLDASVDFQVSDFVYLYENIELQLNSLERKTAGLLAGLTFSPFYESTFRPFATGGVGYFYSYYTHEVLGSHTLGDGGYYAGFGADFMGQSYRNEGFSFSVEAKWLFTREEPYLEQEIKADGRMISVGVKYGF